MWENAKKITPAELIKRKLEHTWFVLWVKVCVCIRVCVWLPVFLPYLGPVWWYWLSPVLRIKIVRVNWFPTFISVGGCYWLPKMLLSWRTLLSCPLQCRFIYIEWNKIIRLSSHTVIYSFQVFVCENSSAMFPFLSGSAITTESWAQEALPPTPPHNKLFQLP